VILTTMPDLPPRPETPANTAFRRDFYRRWGHEWCVVSGTARYAEYAEFEQAFSVKTVTSGREHYYVDGRRITVTPSDYLVLNERRRYASLLESPERATSFCVFYPFGALARRSREIVQTLEQALDAPEAGTGAAPVFTENLRPHDTLVSPVLRHMQLAIGRGVRDERWLEEQCEFLLMRLLRSEARVPRYEQRPGCARASTRRELARRLGWAVDWMRSNLERELTLAELADVAHLSPFHFLRMFRELYGRTPAAWLRKLRTERALALLESTSLAVDDVAARVGMTRTALWRAVRDARGTSPSSARVSSRAQRRPVRR
jgi:AraC family transcriptional regulator